jgi:hypothetical protein
VTYRWLQDLDQALRARGVDYIEYGDWRNNGRPYSTGDFDPQGVLCHHTASPAGCSDQAEIDAIMAGNSSAPGPISQLFIGRSGLVYILAAGRANHGGKGRRPGIDTGGCADMNALLLGIEGGNNGIGEYWPDEQTYSYGEVVFALCDWYGWSIDTDVFLHATTGPPSGGCNSKIDPAGPWQAQSHLTTQTWDLDAWRAWCLTVGGSQPAPQPPQSGGDTDVALVVASMPSDQSWAGFLANASWAPNWNGYVVSSMIWITGDEKANYLAGGLPQMDLNWDALHNIVLEGPLPQGDAAHPGWTGGEFKAWVR